MKTSLSILLCIALSSLSVGCQKDADVKRSSTEPNEAPSPKPSMPEPEPSESAELLDMPWRIVWLDGSPLVAEDTPKPTEVTFDTKEQRVHGVSGCNRFFGTYSLEGSSLSMSQMGATRMACIKGMDKEQQILTALGDTTRFDIQSATLQLYDEKDQLRMKLVPAAPEDAVKATP